MTEHKVSILPPGRTIGILGGGQLGRMTSLAAAEMGYRVHIYAPEDSPPATQVSPDFTQGSYRDERELDAFAEDVDVVMLETENIPLDTARFLENKGRLVMPNSRALEVAQDRHLEKEFFTSLGIGTAEWRPVDWSDQLNAAIASIGTPCILKTRRFGYDGKGQTVISDPHLDFQGLWKAFGSDSAILEKLIPFRTELSVIVARDQGGTVLPYPIAENLHEKQVLRKSVVPADVSTAVARQATEMTVAIAEALDYVGLLAVEYFLTEDDTILANEMAPRPHNTGHWTIDACPTSQFEQIVRVMCGLPMGPVSPFQKAEMVNLIGTDMDHWQRYLQNPDTKVHIYGKSEIREGRKMGHITTIMR